MELLGEKWPVNFYMPQICDMGQDGFYFTSEGRRAEDFFTPKNPTASVRFEPANVGTKGQHATSRPPKPFHNDITA
jgi:hypothetical protein